MIEGGLYMIDHDFLKLSLTGTFFPIQQRGDMIEGTSHAFVYFDYLVSGSIVHVQIYYIISVQTTRVGGVKNSST